MNIMAIARRFVLTNASRANKNLENRIDLQRVIMNMIINEAYGVQK